jgi:hypothetical protein
MVVHRGKAESLPNVRTAQTWLWIERKHKGANALAA